MSFGFETDDRPFFESASTPEGVPHLIQFLWDRYVEDLEEKLEARKKAGKHAMSIDAAKKRAPASHFARFCSNYLAENRVVENFFVDANHGLKLSNNASLVVCPGTDVQGTMQEANDIAVTHGRSQPGAPKMDGGDVFRI